MADLITKILCRQGTDAQRRTANVTGIVFNSGEPAYCTDTKRLYIGDGTTAGGISVATKNLGSVAQLFGNYQNGFTFDAISLFVNKGASVGDFLYDRTTRNVYSLSSVNNFPPLSSDLVKYDTVVQVNSDQMQLINGILNIKQGGIKKENLDFSVVDGTTLEKPTVSDPLKVKLNGIQNSHLAIAPAYTFKGNAFGTSANVQDIVVANNQVIGRSSGSALTAIPISQIFKNSGLSGTNGISFSNLTNTIALDPSYFTVTPFPGSKVTITVPLQVTQGLIINGSSLVSDNWDVGGSLTVANNASINGNLSVTGTATVSGVIANTYSSNRGFISLVKPINVYNGGLTVYGTGYVNAISGTANTITGVTTFNGNVTVNGGIGCSAGASVGGALTVGGNLTVGNPLNPLAATTLIYGTIQARGDIIAYFNPSDSRYKTNLHIIDNALEKVDKLSGYEFNFNNTAPEIYRGKLSYGLIANDVIKVLPHAVENREPDNEGGFYLGVDYPKIVPLLIEAIKELKKEVDHLKTKKSCCGSCNR